MRTRRLGPWWRHLVSSKCGMPVGMADDFPTLRQTVLDTTDARRLAEFYRELLGLAYRPGDEPPAAGEDDALGRDWLVLRNPRGGQLAFQQVDSFPRSTWPDPGVPQQLHLDFTVPSRDVLERVHARALGLGARLLRDDADDPEEPIYVYADPDGHPFCVFVAQT
jgi:catechol 2,3-dioxygenase-like lactoylglutathione lyase family enzyme